MITPYPKSIFKQVFASFQFRNYRLWFAGQLVSLIGTWMQATAQGYLIYTLTNSSAYLGYISIAAGIPAWFLTLYGGVIADRIPRRTLLIITQSFMMFLAFVLAALVFTEIVQPWHILVLAFLLGVANAFDAPARQSFVLELVSREQLTNAIALNSGIFNSGTVVGPAIAGLTYAAIGPAWCFTINGLSFLAVITALVLMRIDKKALVKRSSTAIQELKVGITYVRNNRVIKTLILNLALLSIFGFGVIALVPAWAVEVLNGDVRVNGWLLSSRGAGALIGTLFIAYIGSRRIRGKVWAIGNLTLPVFWIIFSFITEIPTSLLFAFFIGLTLILSINLSNAMVQTEVTDELRGRVMAIFTLIFFGLTPLGSLLAGIAAESFGVQNAVRASGMILLLLAVITALRTQHIRRID